MIKTRTSYGAACAALLCAALASWASAKPLGISIGGHAHVAQTRDIGGIEYVPTREIASLGGGKSYYFPASGRIQLRLRRATIELMGESSQALVNGKSVAMSEKTLWRGPKAYVPASLLSSAVFSAATGISLAAENTSSLASTPAEIIPGKFLRVVIDAGHGGKDSGATGVRGLEEKRITLLAAKQLAEIFRKSGIFDVVMTRDKDVFIPLSGRSSIANKDHADIFISLHCNWARSHRRSGFEIYSMSEQATDPEAEQLAQYENSVAAEGKPSQETQAQLLLDEMGETESFNEGAKLAAFVEREAASRFPALDGGVHKAGFYVLRGTHAPAILVEMDYISNKKGANRLSSESFREKLLESVYAGVLDYVKAAGLKS